MAACKYAVCEIGYSPHKIRLCDELEALLLLLLLFIYYSKETPCINACSQPCSCEGDVSLQMSFRLGPTPYWMFWSFPQRSCTFVSQMLCPSFHKLLFRFCPSALPYCFLRCTISLLMFWASDERVSHARSNSTFPFRFPQTALHFKMLSDTIWQLTSATTCRGRQHHE